MTTLRYFGKILLGYFVLVVALLCLGLATFFLGVGWHAEKQNDSFSQPYSLGTALMATGKVVLTDELRDQLDQEGIWYMVLDPEGKILQSYQLPDHLHRDYSQNDVVRFTRWYLDDYPVFSFPMDTDHSLLVLGYPPGSYDKFPDNYYHFETLIGLLKLALGILAGIFVCLFLAFLRTRYKLQEEMTPIRQGLAQLSAYDKVSLDEEGNLSEIKQAINQTSALLREGKDMRSHWIRGVSHDLRNPLTLMVGNVSQLRSKGIQEPELDKLETHIGSMEHILSNLTMSYLLDDRSVEDHFKEMEVNAWLREGISDFLNGHDEADLEIHVLEKPAYLKGDPSLLTRALHNLLTNALVHNEEVHIQVSLERNQDQLILWVKDDGSISPSKVGELNTITSNYRAHGMGTVITKQIVALHQGSLYYSYGKPGLWVEIVLPLCPEG